MKKKTSTGELYELLETSGDFCAVDKMLETEPITFTRYLKELMKTYQISGTGLMRNSLLSKSYTYQVLDGSRQPERNVVLRLAFSLGCSLKEVQHLRRFRIMEYFIRKSAEMRRLFSEFARGIRWQRKMSFWKRLASRGFYK